MHHSLPAVFAAFCLFISTAVPPPFSAVPDSATAPTSGITIRKEVREVSVNFVVTNANGRPVRGLRPDQIRIFADEDEVRASSFSADENWPLHISVLVDTSDSISASFAGELHAADAFAKRVIRPSIDHVSWIAFAASVAPAPDDTQPSLQLATLRRASPAQTAVYDAICESVANLSKRSRRREPARTALILLSDGEDNWSRHSLADAIDAAQRAGIALYAVTAHDPRREARGDGVLKKLAEGTGGRAFILKSFGQADLAFAQIEQELRAQYRLTFLPPSSARCGLHGIRVAPLDGTLRVQSKTGYFIEPC